VRGDLSLLEGKEDKGRREGGKGSWGFFHHGRCGDRGGRGATKAEQEREWFQHSLPLVKEKDGEGGREVAFSGLSGARPEEERAMAGEPDVGLRRKRVKKHRAADVVPFTSMVRGGTQGEDRVTLCAQKGKKPRLFPPPTRHRRGKEETESRSGRREGEKGSIIVCPINKKGEVKSTRQGGKKKKRGRRGFNVALLAGGGGNSAKGKRDNAVEVQVVERTRKKKEKRRLPR